MKITTAKISILAHLNIGRKREGKTVIN